MGNLYLCISVLGSIISIISWLKSINLKDSKRNIIMYFIISALSVTTSITFAAYKHATDPQLESKRRKEALKIEAKALLEKMPSYISYCEPGENEGIVYSILILLEENSDIFSETYEQYKINVISKIEKANNECDVYEKRKLLDEAGNSAKRILQSLAK